MSILTQFNNVGVDFEVEGAYLRNSGIINK